MSALVGMGRTARGISRSALLLCSALVSPVAFCDGLQGDLQSFNHLKLSEHAQLYGPDNGEAAAFRQYKFTCVRQSDHLPAESEAARDAFQRFVDDARRGVDSGDEGRSRRLDLLAKAVAAGGWRARYFDAMWGLWADRNSPEGRKHFDELLAMAQDGNPAALNGVLHWTGGMYDDMPQRIVVLKAAVERGNPQLLSIVGHGLGTRTRDLRPMGVKMLECAAAQGEGDAYDGLARIAWLEGRWVDAYRHWQRGANLGCNECLSRMEDFVLIDPSASPTAGTFGKEPRVAALRQFYDSQFAYAVSHLIELRVPAPLALQLRWSDVDLVAVIKARIRLYGLP